jgi:hypothetical protein
MRKGNMQNENLQNEIEQPNPSRRFYARLSTKARLGILGVALLVASGLGALALNRVMPRLPNRDQSFTERLGWYVQHGQLKADAHTVASAVGYLVRRESEMPGTVVPTNPPVAGKTTAASPRS